MTENDTSNFSTSRLSKEDLKKTNQDEQVFTTDSYHTDSRRDPNFKLPVNSQNKATKINLLSVARPHMRAFHFAWISFFLSFFAWFSVPPLVTTIKHYDNLTASQKDNTDILASAGTVLARLVVGPMADRYGPRTLQLITLTVFSIPIFLTGATFNYASLAVCRFFIGMVGAAFVVTEFWTNLHFAPKVVGIATATTAGWGNAGAGVANALMPQIYNLFQDFGLDKDKAWRACYIVPGCLLWIVGLSLYFLSDDCPQGNYKKLIAMGQRKKVSFVMALKNASVNYIVWLLFISYAISFGVEVLLNIKLSAYFQSRFGVSQSKAGLAAGLFGLMNIFARTLGGACSDIAAKYFGMKGRLWSLFIFLELEGIFCLAFYEMSSFGASIGLLVPFSIFVQCSTGSVFSIVPFVLPKYVGGVSGIVGAGGNVGSVVFGFLWKLPGVSDSPGKPFFVLSFFIIGLALVVPFIHFPKYGSMFFAPKDKVSIAQRKSLDDARDDWMSIKLDEQVELLSKSCLETLNKTCNLDWQFLQCIECKKRKESPPGSTQMHTTSCFDDEVLGKSSHSKISYWIKLKIASNQTPNCAMFEVDVLNGSKLNLKTFTISLDPILATMELACKLEE
eukprot:jgi/Galph1/1199/GphlegSOOS_G5936.1